ncbi:24027_t:CDS:2 [Dentiscutata erythropus]|uniref:24027_t:CDS:1 n=1 Tax=Dentiscutata erythropus TaxID=1348616 RepID=A0A9N8WBE1_9GLOM|nr:24027_t:CDS:2 [Dentiscutata erythropus]
MNEEETIFVENSSFSLPYIQDGVYGLGDLWDCNLSKRVGFNLFTENFTKDHLIIRPLKKLDYRLTHVKCTEDKFEAFKIDALLGIELLPDIIRIEGEGHYGAMSAKSSNEEQLICQYNLDNYLVELLPQAKDVMDDIVVRRLLDKQLKATHVVRGIILGAEVNADIRIRQRDTSNSRSIRGGFVGKIPCGIVNASLKASLEMLDSDQANNYDKQITIHSKPQMRQQPTTINQMFNLIENVEETCISGEQHFKFVGLDITGVPIRFMLVPITQYIEMNVEKLYKQLQENIFENFRGMLMALKDFQSYEYIRDRVLKIEYRLHRILSDPQSMLSMRILEYQEELRKNTKIYFERACNTLKNYKNAKSNSEELLDIIHEYNSGNFNILKVYEKVESFVEYGKHELNGIHEKDATIMEVDINFFTSYNVLNEWLGSGTNIKILLRTGGNLSGDFPSGAFNHLFGICNALQKRKIDVGIVLPSISENFSLEIRDHRIMRYKEMEIPHVLGILSAVVGMGKPIESRFYMLNASRFNIQLPLEIENFPDLNDLVSLLRTKYKVYLAHSYIDTLQKIRCTNQGNIQWKFFIALDALDTALDAVQEIANFASSKNFLEVEWIIGDSGIPDLHAAPLLFVFQFAEIKAVCLDKLDILILDQLFSNNNPNFSVLSPTSLRYSLYPDRSRFAIEFIKMVNQASMHELDSIELRMPSFNQVPDQSLSDALIIIRSALSGKDLDAISSMAHLVLKNNEGLSNLLIKHEWSNVKRKFSNRIINIESSKLLCKELQDWLKLRNPFLAKVVAAKAVIEQVNIDDENAKSKFTEAINLVSNDKYCSDDIKQKFDSWKENNFKNQCDGVTKILDDLYVGLINNETFHVLSLISLLKPISQSRDIEFSKVLRDKILPIYINRLSRREYPYYNDRWDEIVDLKSNPKSISLLSKLNYGPQLYKLHDKLYKIDSINDKINIKHYLMLLSGEDFKDEHKEHLWRNSRFVYLVQRVNLNMSLATLLLPNLNDKVYPDYIPLDIQEHLRELCEREKFSMEELCSVDNTIKYFEWVLDRDEIPEEFRTLLEGSISKHNVLEMSLKSANVLTDKNWKSEQKMLTEAWDQETIRSSLKRLNQWKVRNLTDEQPDMQKIPNINIPHYSEVPSEHEYDDKTLKVHKNYQPPIGETIVVITPKEYAKICQIYQPPNISDTQLVGCINEALPYIIQKIKMWGCNALTSSNISRLVKKPKREPSFTAKSKKPSFFETSNLYFGNVLDKTTISPLNISEHNKNPLSRFDCIISLLSSAECTVAQDILRIMAKFPMALPLVMPDIEQENEFKVMLPLLTSPIIKWEVKSGVIVENHLFVSPFRLLVALRLGTNSPSGKSTILNQLMATEHMFSSSGEPGASRGPPYTLPGSVEFTWLTQETCSDSLWKNVMEPYYARKMQEIVLLANLHGDALEYKEHIKWLDQIASSFLVFIMPNAGKSEWDQLNKILDLEKLVYVMVDPKYDEGNVIETQRLTNDDTLEIVRSMFNEALNSNLSTLDLSKVTYKMPLKLAENIDCPESQRVINFIKSRSCHETKKIMKLQKQFKATNQDQYDDLLKGLMEDYGRVLTLPIRERRRALAHLERDLYKISAEESSEARKEVLSLKEELKCIIDLTNKNKGQIRGIKNRINYALEQVDSVSLGLEHFFRELGQIYEISFKKPDNNIILGLPKFYTELFIDNRAIELIDGDAGEMPGIWLSAIFKEIDVLFPNLRIFVVSILGLQSSGKSTLLNALFACKFAVSVGRCTRGLFMRLLFLDEKLRDKNKVDAILLIDTEGLGAPEKINDDHAAQSDRLLATYVMEILQIAIVAMARLEKAEIVPDIFMIQHLTERNTEKTASGQIQFCEALQNALNFTDDKDTEMGITNSSCLKEINMRIQKGDFLKQFRPFKNGASPYAPPSEQYHEDVTKLYESILDACRQPHNKITFKKWYTLARSYWESVKNEQFATQFKNIKEMYEFLERSELIAKVKEAVNAAFRAHAKECMMIIRSKISSWSQENGFNKMQAVKGNVREKCKQDVEEELARVLISLKRLDGGHCQECENALNLQTQLIQSLDASIIQTGCTTEFMTEIIKSLKEKLRPSEQFDEKECMNIFEEIWNNLLKIANNKNNVLPIRTRITREVEEEYKHVSIVRQQFQQLIDEIDETDDIDQQGTDNKQTMLKKIGKFVLKTLQLSKTPKYQEIKEVLSEKLRGLPKKIMKEKSADHFESGMVKELQSQVNTLIEDFQNKYFVLKEAQWSVHVDALKLFYDEMVMAQHKWDEKNNPLMILEKRKDTYRTFIIYRLQHGFSFASNGAFAAEYLHDKIKKKAVKSANDERKRLVLAISWLNSTTHARIKYFKQLAEKVKNYKFFDALNHFSNPKYSIEYWFKEIVDKCYPDVPQTAYSKTFENEFSHVINEIETHSTISEILNFIKKYLDEPESVEFKAIEEASEEDEIDIDLFRDSMLKILRAKRKECILIKPEDFCMPSAYEEIMEKLGCTHSCFWCGALCWGSRGHEDNNDDTKLHHTCHQPQGLRGTHEITSKKLRAWPCHRVDDNTGCKWGEIKYYVKWSVAKKEHFPEWVFLPHHKTIFNNLMCWFFQELHKKIAHMGALLPADRDEMQKYECVGLDCQKIINELSIEIGDFPSVK